VYLDGGFAPALELVSTHFASDLEEKPAVTEFDSKTQLQEVTQKIFKQTPVYEVVEVRGPDHQKRFVSQVLIAGKPYGHGEGPSKKSAHQAAASQTLALLQDGKRDE
jgi:ribonuclease-3